MKYLRAFSLIVVFAVTTQVAFALEPPCKWDGPKWVTVDTYDVLEVTDCCMIVITYADQIDCEGDTRVIILSTHVALP